MADKVNLRQLSAGHYHLVPDNLNTYHQLTTALKELQLDCICMPPIVTDYLLSDSVLREAAFDLENRGVSGRELVQQSRAIYRGGYFDSLLEQSPTTLSVGEQQLLAVTLALNQNQTIIVGQYCFDFLSEINLSMIEDDIFSRGKVFIDITQRNHGRRWQLAEHDLVELAVMESGDQNRALAPGTQAPWTISFHNLHKSYKSSNFLLAIEDLALEINGVLGIVGGNGSGKSTLGRCIAGLLDFSGDIVISSAATASTRVGYLIQQAATPTHGLSLIDLIARFTTEERLPTGRGEELLQILQESPIYQHLRESDAAMGYRLALAAILLAGDYDLVILDEPTYGLPAQPTAEFIDIIHHQFGSVPLILISHDSNFLSSLCNTFLNLHHGSIDG